MDLLFVKALNMSISASWLVLAVLVLRLLLKKAPRWIHVALWALVAVRLICPVSLESVFSLIPSTQTVPEEIFYLEPPLDSQNTTLEIVQPRPNGEAVDVELNTTVSIAQTRSVSWAFIWPAGMAVMALYALISYLRLKRKVSASIDVGNGVYICDYIDTPFILGILSPKIYLPSAMEPDSASHVLAHERAHIARKDHWWKPLGYTLLTVYWFNPVLWLAYILLCRDIELACDEKVIRDMAVPEKKAYSEALLSCSVSRRSIAACPLAFGEVGVKERVKTVLNYKKPAFWIVLVAVGALIVTAVCFLTDPVARTDKGAVQWFEEYAYEEVKGRMDRDEVVCLDAREGYALVYCQGQGPTLTLYRYEKKSDEFRILDSCAGDYAISGGMSLNHLEDNGKHIYFGTASQYHWNPKAEVNTWLNWDYMTLTDAKGKQYKKDMTGKKGFLFVLDAPMADFQAVDGLGTVCLNYEKYADQGYTIRECWLVSSAASEEPFGKYYRLHGPSYRDHVPESYLGLDEMALYLLTEGHGLLTLDAMDWSEVTTVARFDDMTLTAENFDTLFRRDPQLAATLRENNLWAWEYHAQQPIFENYHDCAYLLQQKDGTLYVILGQIWDGQYRNGESLIRSVYVMEPISSDDPFAESASPYQWTLNLRPDHVQLVQMTVYDPQGVPQHRELGQQEMSSFLDIINSLTEDQITRGKLQRDHVITAYVQCRDENGWNTDLDVMLQYDGSAVRMVYTTEGAKRYPETEGKYWIIHSDELNDFLSVYIYKTPQEDPLSDPDNAYRWCSNIRQPYLTSAYVTVAEKDVHFLKNFDTLQTAELLRILNTIPEAAFEKAERPESYRMEVYLTCRNLRSDSTGGIGISIELTEDAVYYTQVDGLEPRQTWKISSHALKTFIQELNEENKVSWYEFSAIAPVTDTHKVLSCQMFGVELCLPELDCFIYEIGDDGIRFRPEDQDGWILAQYQTEHFAVCGTGLETSVINIKNGKYIANYGYYDGSKVWSFIDIVGVSGDTAWNSVLINESDAPWVTEYGYEILELISEMTVQTDG